MERLLVPFQLRAQRLRAFEFHDGAQKALGKNAHLRAVQIARKIVEIRLRLALRHAEGRAGAEIDDGGKVPGGRTHTPCIHALAGRRLLRGDGQVERGKTQHRPADVPAVLDAPRQKVGAQQQRICPRHVPARHHRLDAGGRDLFTARFGERKHRDGTGRQRPYEPRIPRGVFAEAEVLAAKYRFHVRPLEQFAQEILRRRVAEALGKVILERKGDALLRKDLPPLVAREQFAARLPAQDGGDAHGKPRPPCAGEQGAMSAVQPVKPAQEQRAGHGKCFLCGYDQHSFFSARAMPASTRAMP